jgi:uncharacterized protein
MEKRVLGRTGIEVTELSFGALPYGPLQKKLGDLESAAITGLALQSGINFIDTAHTYGTYEPIRLAIKQTGIRPVIASKSPAITYEDMKDSILYALSNLDIEYIDIFLLHAARGEADVFEKRSGAWQCLKDFKEKGIIRAIGISTHNPAVVKVAAKRDDVDIVFPIINKCGKGIYNGTKEEMLEGIEQCVCANKGIYIMKALGGGTLVSDYKDSIDYVRSINGYASIAIGMVSTSEVEYNIAYFNGITDIAKLPTIAMNSKHYSILSQVCGGCGKCIAACHSSAIKIEAAGKAVIDNDKCVCCGYCSIECPNFAIRFV